ncbi:MAG: hypothetical protein QXW76_07500 [Candidatus Korarchaeum sp.]
MMSGSRHGHGNIHCSSISLKISSREFVFPEKFNEIVHEMVKEIADECIRRGAKAIGHIKLYLKTESGYVRADTVGIKYGVNVESNIKKPEREALLMINSIVIGLNEEELSEVTIDTVRKVLQSNKFFHIIGDGE